MYKKVIFIMEGLVLGCLGALSVLSFMYERRMEAYVMAAAIVIILAVTLLILGSAEIPVEKGKRKIKYLDFGELKCKIPCDVMYMDDEHEKMRVHGDMLEIYEKGFKVYSDNEIFDEVEIDRMVNATCSNRDDMGIITIVSCRRKDDIPARLYGFQIDNKLKEKIFIENIKKMTEFEDLR